MKTGEISFFTGGRLGLLPFNVDIYLAGVAKLTRN